MKTVAFYVGIIAALVALVFGVITGMVQVLTGHPEGWAPLAGVVTAGLIIYGSRHE